MSADAWTARVVGVVKKALHVQIDGLETVLAAMCEPQIAIVSLTITEKGYFHSPATGQLMLDHPMVAADVQNPHQPKTATGVIVEALARLKRQDFPHLPLCHATCQKTVMLCVTLSLPTRKPLM